MLERMSALGGVTPWSGEGIRISEAADFTLTQVAGESGILKKCYPRLAQSVGSTAQDAGTVLLRLSPQQLWIIGPAPEHKDGLFLTPLASSRTRIVIEGSRGREVLAKCAAIDFHHKAFIPDRFAMTGIHHMPVLIHCTAADQFHVYVMRTFALSLWEVLVDAAVLSPVS